MTNTHLEPGDLPDWPRWLSRKLAAAYVGRGVTKFMQEVKAGRWPKPDDRGLWDKVAIDRESDKQSGVSVINPWLETRDEGRIQGRTHNPWRDIRKPNRRGGDV